MPSILNPAANKQLVDRLDSLTADCTPLWGKMTAAQMLAHAQYPLRVATGEMPLKRNLFGILFGKMAKKKLLKPGDYEHNMMTAPEFRVKDEPSFDREKRQLRALIERFTAEGANIFSKKPHPFFGDLSTDEWDILQWKHLDHHLRQFGK